MDTGEGETMRRFRTENSTYEMDTEARLIRRIIGVNPPTPRQGPDGYWRPYRAVSPLYVGYRVFITYADMAVGKGTITSPVVEVLP